MARNLGEFFQSSERVFHHVPAGWLKPNWRKWLGGAAALGAMVFLFFWLVMEPGNLSSFAVFLATFWAIVTALSLLENQESETAVTEQRVINIKKSGAFRYTEVALDEIQSALPLGHSVYIVKNDGKKVRLRHEGHAPDIAAALARAARLGQPRTPPKIRIAYWFTLFALTIGMGAGMGYALRFLPDPDGFLLIALRVVLSLAAAIPAGMAAGFVAVSVLRRFLTKDEVRACVLEVGTIPFADGDLNRPGLFIRILLRSVDWLYSRA